MRCAGRKRGRQAVIVRPSLRTTPEHFRSAFVSFTGPPRSLAPTFPCRSSIVRSGWCYSTVSLAGHVDEVEAKPRGPGTMHQAQIPVMTQESASNATSDSAMKDLEARVAELTRQLNAMRKEAVGPAVRDYEFQTLDGAVRLSQLFSGRDKLLAIHNMGHGCRYCTLWADGINGFLQHLEPVMAVVLFSKDPPETQRRFANSRGWRFRLASHSGGTYIREQSTNPEIGNMPGAVLYELGDGVIRRKNSVVFGPGDMFCSAWNLLALAGLDEDSWTPQYSYWQRPVILDDGGKDLIG